MPNEVSHGVLLRVHAQHLELLAGDFVGQEDVHGHGGLLVGVLGIHPAWRGEALYSVVWRNYNFVSNKDVSPLSHMCGLSGNSPDSLDTYICYQVLVHIYTHSLSVLDYTLGSSYSLIFCSCAVTEGLMTCLKEGGHLNQ